MGFFDLNVPYSEHSSSPSFKAARIKIVTKIMELGFSGVAFNRTISGVMSDRDRCSICRLTLPSLLKVAPSLSSAVEFHRDLLDIPRSSPFRQYTRLTVCLNTPSEVLSINPGNLILKTYDLVSVKPLNQHAFDQSCEKLEIDIITIDFANKLPFRLKQSMVKSAIQRGVYFEITYSNLIRDVHERRQMISTAKMLVDWTRGRNLIFSSAASSVNEIRGPYDIANLSSLLGLSMERAKAAISKNCRTLIVNALRKKQFYKETIRVERVPSTDKFDPKGPWSADLFKWDPISCGEGDLLLDDMAKCFATCTQESKTVKAIDFTSVIDNMPSQGFQVKDILLATGNKDLLQVSNIIEPPVAEIGVTQQSHLPQEEHCSLSDHHCSVIENLDSLNYTNDAKKVFSSTEEVRTTIDEIVQPKTFVHEETIRIGMDDMQSQNSLSSSESNVAIVNEIVNSPTSSRDLLAVCDNNEKQKEIRVSESVDSPQDEDVSRSSDMFSGAENASTSRSISDLVSQNPLNMSLAEDSPYTTENCLLGVTFREPGDVGAPKDQVSLLPPFPKSNINGDFSISIQKPTSDAQMKEQNYREADTRNRHSPMDHSLPSVMSTGKCRNKRKRNHTAPLLPFKRLAFKKIRKNNYRR